MRSSLILVLSALAASAAPLCIVNPSTWCEVTTGDAGRLPGTAENTLGSGALNDIIGLVNGLGGADLYSIYIPDPSAFSAITSPASGNLIFGDLDPTLALFNFQGLGIEANDDISRRNRQAQLGPFSGPAGVYLILVTGSGNLPEYRSGLSLLPIFQTFAFGQISAPVAGARPLVRYDGNGCGLLCAGGYDVSLTGADFANLPEPGTDLLAGAGLLVVLARKRRQSTT